jgi:hypothetical protein
MLKKRKQLRMIIPAGQCSVVIELPFRAREAAVSFIEASRPNPSPACNPTPSDQVSCSLVSFNSGETRGLQINWNCSGPREIEWVATTGRL